MNIEELLAGLAGTKVTPEMLKEIELSKQAIEGAIEDLAAFAQRWAIKQSMETGIREPIAISVICRSMIQFGAIGLATSVGLSKEKHGETISLLSHQLATSIGQLGVKEMAEQRESERKRQAENN